MGMLVKAKEEYITLRGKSIIAMYGNTGGGKSTTTNYLIGVSLEYFVNSYGDRVVRVKSGAEESAKIGQSLSTSETIYSKGYALKMSPEMEEELGGLIKMANLALCDNPGFGDTRASEYELVTNLSMDRAITECLHVKAVALVVPYEIFSLERAIHFIDLMNQVAERFPKILDYKEKHFQALYIFITKSN